MESYKINRYVIFVLMLFLSYPASESADIHGSRFLQIYVDSNNRIFWNICNPADSLPYLLPPDTNAPDSIDYKIDMRGLYDLLLEKNRLVKRLYNLIYIHPKAHYSCVDRILAAIHWMEWVWNDKTAYDLGISVKELDKGKKFVCNFVIGRWEDRNDRILEAVWQKRNIPPAGPIKIPLEQTYSFRLKNGYWDNKISKERIDAGPTMAKPKIGIPMPVSNDEVIDVDIMIASRENLSKIITDDEKETTTVSRTKINLDNNENLPIAVEIGPGVIPAEQIYYQEPNYPRLAQTASMEAVVWVKALVDKEGNVRDAIILKSANSKAGFDEAAARAAYKCRYKPAIQNGQPVATWVSYEVEFYCLKDK